jgi:hypothetical protein
MSTLKGDLPASPTDVIFRRAAAIRAVQGAEVNPFSRALAVLEQVADAVGVPLAIVGGLAGIYHQAVVTTLDVDVVVPRDHSDSILTECQRQGLALVRQSPAGWHLLRYKDNEGEVDINLLPEGGRTPRDPPHAPPIPGPRELGVERGLGYASFAGWVGMKLAAARDKDRYHLVEALKNASQERIAEAVQVVRQMDPIYLNELERLLRAAEDEDERNW